MLENTSKVHENISQKPPKDLKDLPKTSQRPLKDLSQTNLVKFLAVVWRNQYGCIQSVGEKRQVQTLLWSMFDVDFEVQVAENKCCLEYDFELGY